ncbi:MAG: hypothetical protein ACO3UU_17155, partial [Minisyncoccia bacterium]
MIKEDEIDEIVNLKKMEIDKRNYIKYQKLYDIGIKVLVEFREHVILYGGYAINILLPKELQFYNEYELSDIDILCDSGMFEFLKIQLYNAYKDADYEYITIREAIHNDTYKLIVDGVHIFDISITDTESFNAIMWGGVETVIGIYTAGIDFLKYSLHLLLSKPEDSFRWPKIYPRMIKLYSQYPPISTTKYEYDFKDFAIEAVPRNINKAIKKFVSDPYNNCVSFGWYVIDIYLREGGIDNINFSEDET